MEKNNKTFHQIEYEIGIKQYYANRKLWQTPKKIRYPLISLLPENYNPAIFQMLIKDTGPFGAILLKMIAEPLDFFKQLGENWNK